MAGNVRVYLLDGGTLVIDGYHLYWNAGDAIVAVAATAICGADLLPVAGRVPGFEWGTVLGHEFAGVVTDAGPEVPFRPGGDIDPRRIISHRLMLERAPEAYGLFRSHGAKVLRTP